MLLWQYTTLRPDGGLSDQPIYHPVVSLSTELLDVNLPQVIRACCSPLESVAFLNNLYKIMDRRLDQFDVYKVESISDTYLVASGD